MRFFDSLPTNQSRLLTFRCPYYKTRPETKHYLTVAWKFTDPKNEQEVCLLSENVSYVGKPLALFPSAIESHKKEVFPLGTLYTTCSCMPERNGKICYISTDVVDVSNISIDSPAETSKIRKKLDSDFKVTNRLLIQIYDVLEDIQEEQIKQKKEWKKTFAEYQEKVPRKTITDEKINNISKFLMQLPNYLEERFQKNNDEMFVNSEAYSKLMEEVDSLQKSLLENKHRVERKKTSRTLAPVDIKPKFKREKEKYIDLFGETATPASTNTTTPTPTPTNTTDPALSSVLEEPKAKTNIKKSFSVTQVLNKSALARQAKDQGLEQIFDLNDKKED